MRQDLDKEHLLGLTLALYRVTELFPTEEPLKFQIRESADKVLADLLLDKTDENGVRRIKEILELFDLADSKHWVDSRNFLVLKREYGKIGHAMFPCLKWNIKQNERKEKVLGILRGNGKTKVGDLIKVFPQLNRRTLLRDLEELTRMGVIVRNGNGRGAHYVAINAT